jgi:hypothetical protein
MLETEKIDASKNEKKRRSFITGWRRKKVRRDISAAIRARNKIF